MFEKWITEVQERKQGAFSGRYRCGPHVKHGHRNNQRSILETELIGLVQGLDVRGEAERRIKGRSRIICLQQLGREWSP